MRGSRSCHGGDFFNPFVPGVDSRTLPFVRGKRVRGVSLLGTGLLRVRIAVKSLRCRILVTLESPLGWETSEEEIAIVSCCRPENSKRSPLRH